MGAAHHMRFPSDFCTFVLQPYSSWSCSPAELHYASDCGAKVQNWLESGKCKEGKNTLQFELLTTYLSKIPCKMSYTPNFSLRVYSKRLITLSATSFVIPVIGSVKKQSLKNQIASTHTCFFKEYLFHTVKADI